jgi:hypothetical protein
MIIIPSVREHASKFYLAHLKIHISICADQKSFIFKTPLEADVHELAGQLLHERLRVYGVDLEIAKIHSDKSI